MNMRSVLGLLVIWVAELFDSSLLTVPDLDVDEPETIDRRDRASNWTSQILRAEAT
jgi:hypothetical protein